MTESEEFLNKHKKRTENFTRHRKLPFSAVLTLILRKSVKSLQLILNEWCRGLDKSISASALSQARQKFSHTAFLELLERCVVQPMYGDGEYERYRGYRLLAIDGTTLRLPTNKVLIEEFGTTRYMNGRQKVACDNVESKASVLYDVLNEIPLAGSLHRARANDIRAAKEHISLVGKGDIVMADRGYCSYAFFADIQAQSGDFIVRLRDKTYQEFHSLFTDKTQKEAFIKVPCPDHFRSEPGIPSCLSLRLIRVELPDGEVEVLATSLLNKRKFPLKDFKKLYYQRWRIETYFQTIKSRLTLDNFTGRTVEAIKQDFFSTLFISGLETILTADTNEELAQKANLHEQKVNKAISFHAIKDQILLLMFDPPEDFEERVKKLFLINPTLQRPYREKNRERLSMKSNARSLHFQKFARKFVF